MDRWDVLIVVVAGYLSVMALVRLMARRRDELVGHVREQIDQQQGQKQSQNKGAKNSDEGASKDAA